MLGEGSFREVEDALVYVLCKLPQMVVKEMLEVRVLLERVEQRDFRALLVSQSAS